MSAHAAREDRVFPSRARKLILNANQNVCFCGFLKRDCHEKEVRNENSGEKRPSALATE